MGVICVDMKIWVVRVRSRVLTGVWLDPYSSDMLKPVI